MKPYQCPICLGTGNVCGGFYNCCPGGTPVSSNTMENCRSCFNGIIYAKESNFEKFGGPHIDQGDKEDLITVCKDIRGHLLTIIEELQKIGRNV